MNRPSHQGYWRWHLKCVRMVRAEEEISSIDSMQIKYLMSIELNEGVCVISFHLPARKVRYLPGKVGR